MSSILSTDVPPDAYSETKSLLMTGWMMAEPDAAASVSTSIAPHTIAETWVPRKWIPLYALPPTPPPAEPEADTAMAADLEPNRPHSDTFSDSGDYDDGAVSSLLEPLSLERDFTEAIAGVEMFVNPEMIMNRSPFI